jgi:4-carboxymuconolactone decarboxylase
MRLPELNEDQLTPGQKEIYGQAKTGKRGHVPAPLLAWIHSEKMARHANLLGAFVRYDTKLEPRLSELAILVTARYWTAQYEWYAHESEALKGGLDPAIIKAIATRQTPVFQKADEELVYTFSKTLHETKNVSPELHAKAQKMFGDQVLVELIGILGYYTMVAMTLNVFDFSIPPTATPLQP